MHFGAIHRPKFAVLNSTHMHKTSMQHFYDFFPNADSVHVVSSSSSVPLLLSKTAADDAIYIDSFDTKLHF